jgi:2-C-methyl-D-erythritol 2,4-cyclodiphosphate synthase
MIPRVGFGYDVHRLVPGEFLRIGGISIPHTSCSLGHSDADVLIHAICDALLGSAGLRDIGFHFPDNDPSLKGIDSTEILKSVMKLLHQHMYSVVNVDATVVLQIPRIATYIPQMRALLAPVLGLTEADVSVKATTEEHLGFTGREEGIAAYAVVMVVRQA